MIVNMSLPPLPPKPYSAFYESSFLSLLLFYVCFFLFDSSHNALTSSYERSRYLPFPLETPLTCHTSSLNYYWSGAEKESKCQFFLFPPSCHYDTRPVGMPLFFLGLSLSLSTSSFRRPTSTLPRLHSLVNISFLSPSQTIPYRRSTKSGETYPSFRGIPFPGLKFVILFAVLLCAITRQ